MKLVQVIYNNRFKEGKDGVKRKLTMFYLVNEDNGKRVAIQPSFKEGYNYFDAWCTIEFNDSLPKSKEEPKK